MGGIEIAETGAQNNREQNLKIEVAENCADYMRRRGDSSGYRLIVRRNNKIIGNASLGQVDFRRRNRADNAKLVDRPRLELIAPQMRSP